VDLKTLEYAVGEIKEELHEVKTDVKALMLFMAVEKANQRRNVVITSTLISVAVSTFGGVLHYFLK
jgi:hypothetical protein